MKCSWRDLDHPHPLLLEREVGFLSHSQTHSQPYTICLHPPNPHKEPTAKGPRGQAGFAWETLSHLCKG